jgi:hypothetical protein
VKVPKEVETELQWVGPILAVNQGIFDRLQLANEVKMGLS